MVSLASLSERMHFGKHIKTPLHNEAVMPLAVQGCVLCFIQALTLFLSCLNSHSMEEKNSRTI